MGDHSLMTNQGVGLDRVGELLQKTDYPGLVRYRRSFAAPNAIITEVYLKSSQSVPQFQGNKSFKISA